MSGLFGQVALFLFCRRFEFFSLFFQRYVDTISNYRYEDVAEPGGTFPSQYSVYLVV